MDESIPTKTTVRGVINDLLELADNEKKPTIMEIKNIHTLDTLFDYLKNNFSPREYWLSCADDAELVYLSTQILGASHYDDFAYKIGLKNNGVLPIIASLAYFMDGPGLCND